MDARRREVDEKRRRVDAFLEAHELDGLLLTRQANFAWATAGGANWVSGDTEVGVATLLLARGEQPRVFCDNIEAPRIAAEELEGLGFAVVECPWYGGPARHEQVRDIVGPADLGSDLPWPEARDLSGAVKRERFLLTPDEADRYRQVGHMAGTALEEAAASVRRGMSEWEIAGRIGEACLSRGLRPFVTLVAADERALSFRHFIPTEKRVDRYAIMVICARKGGLVANCTRAVSFGPLDPELARRHEAVQRVDALVNLSTKPGARMTDLFETIRGAYAEVEFPDEWQHHHQGGATGYEAREYVATPSSHEAALDRQAFAWNPSVPGAKSEDTVLISPERGLEVITRPADSSWPVRSIDVEGLGAMERPEILVL